MQRKLIEGPVNDNMLNNQNHNFKVLFDAGIKSGLDATEAKAQALEALSTAKSAKSEAASASNTANAIDGKASSAIVTADASKAQSQQAENKADSVQSQFDQVLIDGDSSVEAAAARIGTDNEAHATLKKRLDSENQKVTMHLMETDHFRGNESMINRKRRRPMMTIFDDDGHRGVFTKYRPLALEYGIVFSSGIITDRPMGFPGDERPYNSLYIHYDEIKQMQEEGTGEFVSHTHTHNINYRHEHMTEEERLNDMRLSRAFLKKHGLNYRAMAYAFGTYSQDVVETARQVWDYCIGTGTRGDEIVVAPFDNYDMRRSHGQGTVERIKGQIDKAVENNAWVIFTTHIDQGDWYTEQNMREIIEYALSKGVEFVTTEQGYAAHGNIAQLTATDGISAEGEPFGTKLGSVSIDHSTDINGDTPISYFKKDAITHSRIGANRGGFPNNISGFLETHRYDVDTWVYQKFTTTRDKIIYIRAWDRDNEEWEKWINSTPPIYLGANAVKVTDVPTDSHLFNRITLVNINSQGNADFPEQSSGTLTTYALSEPEFARQEYRIYRSIKTYERWWLSSTLGWSNWVGVQNTPASFIKPLNTITATTLPVEFDMGITITRVSAIGGFVGDKTGTVTTYIMSKTEHRYAYQEFKVNGEFSKYIRQGQTDGTWSDWMKYAFETV